MDVAPDLDEFGFCPFAVVAGQPCPLCGGTRAFTALLRGDVGVALQMNAVVAVGVVVLAAITAARLRSVGFAGVRRQLAALGTPPANPRRVNLQVTAFLVVWWCWNLGRW